MRWIRRSTRLGKSIAVEVGQSGEMRRVIRDKGIRRFKSNTVSVISLNDEILKEKNKTTYQLFQ